MVLVESKKKMKSRKKSVLRSLRVGLCLNNVSCLFLNNIRLHLQILNDKFLAIRGVFAHVKGEQILNDFRLCRKLDGGQSHVISDEMLKLIR